MGIKTRRWWAVVAAVFTALALFVAPKTALAIEGGNVYSDPDKGIYITVDSGGVGIKQTLSVDIVIDGEHVVTDHVVSDIPQDSSTIQISTDGYAVSKIECSDMLTVSPSSANGQWSLQFWKAGSNSYDMTIYLTKTSADIKIGNDAKDYGTFSWSKPSATNFDYRRNVIIKVNGVEEHTQEVSTPEQLLNTNADTVASGIAMSLASKTAVDLVFCFEKDGVLADKDDDSSLIEKIDAAAFERLKAGKVVADGMLPKLENAFKAIANGVSQVVIKNSDNVGNSRQTTILWQ